MSFYQLRGLTGMRPKRNEMAEIYEQSALLPAYKEAEYARKASERSADQAERGLEQNQAYYNRMAGLQEDANEAAERDRNRGLLLQGGMALAGGYNALNDAVGGDLAGKTASTIKDVFTPAVDGRGAGSFAKNAYSAYGGDNNWSLAGAAGNVGEAAKDYLIDPIASGAKKLGNWAADAGKDFMNWIFS